jgi:peptidoglycan hydrolase CwlO-like protein
LWIAVGPAGRGASKEGGPENANNLFASESGLLAYTQTLDEKVGQLMDKIKGLEGHIVTLERTKTSQEIQISNLTDQVTRLRQEVLDARARPPLIAQT